MASLYAICTNAGKCRKTGPDDIVEFDPTIGGVVVCSACGRRLTPVPSTTEYAAVVAERDRTKQAEPARAADAAQPPVSFGLNSRLALAATLLVLASLGAFAFFNHIVAADSVGTIRVCGASTATAHLADDFARTFFQTNGADNVEIEAVEESQTTVTATLAGDSSPSEIQIAGRGTSRGFAALAAGQCDLVLALRPISDEERASVRDVRGHTIGRDGIVVAVNAAGYVDRLSDEQLRGIYSGAITSWAQVGGPDRKIDLILPDDSTEYSGLRAALLGDEEPAGSAQQLPMATIAAALSSDRDGVAIGSYAALDSARPLRIAGRLSDLVPSLQNIQTGAYPFAPRLYVYTARETVAPRLLPSFVAYLRSAAAGSVLSSDGLVANR
jgi:ABC-type phosphate transport system substrate-binding protein